MSLINKMLQDLDARGGAPGQGMQGSIKSVARDEPRVSMAMIAGGVAGVALLGAAAYYGWQLMKRPAVVATAPVAAAVAKPAVIAPPAAPAAAPLLPRALGPVPAEPAPEAQTEAAPAPIVKKAAPAKRSKKQIRAEKAAKAKQAKAARVKAAPAAVPAAAPAEGRSASAPMQKAEGEYRRALASMGEGRVTEAIAALELALQAEPRHEAARQTLVGLLVENKRKDEAQRVLQAGLALDPRQPSMAMLLARLQIEQGTSGIDTLMKTLPYANNNPEYHAFLAGALQRESRHREAAEQYEAALRGAPNNGVWWMGLGLSMQAEKRDGEAIVAYERARDSGTLNAQLKAFVERKLAGLKP
jgi:MSHA biogenesis protein MshN